MVRNQVASVTSCAFSLVEGEGKEILRSLSAFEKRVTLVCVESLLQVEHSWQQVHCLRAEFHVDFHVLGKGGALGRALSHGVHVLSYFLP